MKILYIGKKISSIQGGVDAINNRNITLMEAIPEVEIHYIYPESNTIIGKWRFGVSNKLLKDIEEIINSKNITHIFLSQSLFGRIVKLVKKKYSYIEIITFCHNIEVDYAKSYLKSVGLKALPFYLAVKRWEKIALLNSSKIITLNSRDSRRLRMIYNRNSDIELPTSFDDEFDAIKADQIYSKQNKRIDFLFVGVAFFPNIQGIQWFIDNVLPNINGELFILGKGMDKVDFNNLNDRIHILGYVPDLSEYYYRARCVVSPIFTGAGMKTKTAEALMYGKTIVGTKEAFEGYAIDSRCMRCANNVTEFVEELTNILATPSDTYYNEASRRIFLENYETNKLQKKFESIIKK